MTRTIAVAVTGTEGDLAALSWAANAAEPGDAVHVVHAFTLLSFAECSWRPAMAANDERRDHARRVVAAAVQILRSRNRTAAVDGSAVAGRALPVLVDTSTLADLLVICDRAETDGCRIASALARRCACPIVIVTTPYAESDARPVALLVDAADLPTAAVEFAFEQAARRHVELVVAEPVQAAPRGLPVCDDDISTWEETADRTLPMDIAAWQQKFHDAGVIVEVRHESPAATVRLLERTCQLVITSRGGRPHDPLGSLARTALRHAQCPVVIVP